MKITLEGSEVTEYLAWKYGISPSAKLIISVTDLLTGLPLERVGNMFQQPVDKKALISLSFVDQFGNIAPAPTGTAAPSWKVSDTSLATLVVAADGMSAQHETVAGALGSDTITVAAGALGGSVSIQFVPGTAVALNLSIGALSPR